jgi:hypothetical protein
MARNRKSQSAAIRFGPALKAFLLCLLIGGSGVGFVWQKDQIVRLGRQIKNRELRLAQLQRQNDELSHTLASMRTPHWLELRIAELKLGLGRPLAGQIWQLVEPAAEPPRTPAERQYAAQTREGLLPP